MDREFGGTGSLEVSLDVLDLLGPAVVIHAEGFVAAGGGDFVEAGLGELEAGAGGGWFEGEFDEGGDFFGVVDVGVDAVGMPGEGEEAFRLHLLDHGGPFDVFVAGPGDVAGGDLAGDEWAVEFDAKPLAEFLVIGEGSPDAGDGGVEFDLLFDAVGLHRQPPGCMIAWRERKGNCLVARFMVRCFCVFPPRTLSPKVPDSFGLSLDLGLTGSRSDGDGLNAEARLEAGLAFLFTYLSIRG